MSVPPTIVAEIGCNHKGDMRIAHEMIVVAARFCDADYVKFQKRNIPELLTPEQYAAPHPNPVHSFGDTYGAHREFLEFDLNQHRQLKEWCSMHDIGYATSVWDVGSAREIMSLDPDYIKVPSGSNQHYALLEILCDEFHGQIHCSLGMTSKLEIERLVEFFRRKDRMKDLVLYACTSGYPVAFKDVCLKEITRLQEAYGSEIAAIGFSGHHIGIAADIAAQTLGAEWIERHYTLDKTWKGSDHAASLEPDEVRSLCRNARSVAEALEYKPTELLAVELPQRAKLKWGEYNRKRAVG